LLRAFAVLSLGFGTLSLAACGGEGVKLFPVSGKVLLNDAPLEGATVVLQPTDPALDWRPTGTTKADGSFTVTTYPHGEGAPNGDYVVLISQYAPDAREKADPKSEIPRRYADPEKALFHAKVADGPVVLEPFKLTKKAKEKD